MAWYSFLNDILDPFRSAEGAIFGNGNGAAATAANQQARAGLANNANQANGFANAAQANYGLDTGQLNRQADYLRQIQSGQNSVSAEQLRQALQQNMAAQRSMAAGASPQNAAMAARTAAIQSAKLGSGLAGQQALAGIQERNAAASQLGNLLGNMRGQDLQGTLGGYNAANQGYGNMINQTGDQSKIQQNSALISAIAAAAAASDRNLKTDIKDGGDDAQKLLEGLKAYSYKYKDDKYGKGKQLGVMAQDLERAGLKAAVTDTPAGKMVDGAKLALGLAAVLPGLNERITRLEDEDEAPGAKRGPDAKRLGASLAVVMARRGRDDARAR